MHDRLDHLALQFGRQLAATRGGCHSLLNVGTSLVTRFVTASLGSLSVLQGRRFYLHREQGAVAQSDVVTKRR